MHKKLMKITKSFSIWTVQYNLFKLTNKYIMTSYFGDVVFQQKNWFFVTRCDLSKEDVKLKVLS